MKLVRSVILLREASETTAGASGCCGNLDVAISINHRILKDFSYTGSSSVLGETFSGFEFGALYGKGNATWSLRFYLQGTLGVFST